ncbi:MAG TPA: type II secretion system protein GspM [Burkholderiales bacterium]|nr:type II secretion system protein GspM [Burkholderiales bacterium]
MIAALRSYWLGLSRRERTLSGAGIGIVLCAAAFLVAVEPAWKTQARLRTELPELREQAAELAALAQEAERLREHLEARPGTAELKDAIGQSLSRAGLEAASVAVVGEGQWTVRAQAVPAGQWLGWLEQVARELRLRVGSARIARGDAVGLIDVEVTLNAFPKR